MPTKEINQFHGGITDYPLGAQEHYARELDNLFVNENNKLEQRAGIQQLDKYYDVQPNAESALRMQKIVWIPDSTVAELRALVIATEYKTGNVLFFYAKQAANGTWSYTYLANPFWGRVNLLSQVDVSIWKAHVYITAGNSKLDVNDNYPTLKFYVNQSDTPILTKAGIDVNAILATNWDSLTRFTPTAGTGDTKSYLYAAHFQYFYNDKERTLHSEVSRVFYFNVQVRSVGVSATRPVRISFAPAFATVLNSVPAGASNWRLKLYRTIGNGGTYYFIKEFAQNESLSDYNDTFSDDTLAAQTTIYSDGVDFELFRAPEARFIHVKDSVGWYGYQVKSNFSSQENYKTNRLVQSVPGNIDAIVPEFFIEFDETITGLGSFKDNLIVFTDRGVYAVNGNYTLDGNNPTVKKIDSTFRLNNFRSIQEARDELYCLGHDGIYKCNGSRVMKTDDKLNRRFEYLNFDYMDSAYDGNTERIYFLTRDFRDTRIRRDYDAPDSDRTVSAAINTGIIREGDNNRILVLDIRRGGARYMWRAFGIFNPSAIVHMQFNIFFGARDGMFYQFTDRHNWDEPLPDVLGATHGEDIPIVSKWGSIPLRLGELDQTILCSYIIIETNSQFRGRVMVIFYDQTTDEMAGTSSFGYGGSVTWGDNVEIPSKLPFGHPDVNWRQRGGIKTEPIAIPHGMSSSRYHIFDVQNWEQLIIRATGIVDSNDLTKFRINLTTLTAANYPEGVDPSDVDIERVINPEDWEFFFIRIGTQQAGRELIDYQIELDGTGEETINNERFLKLQIKDLNPADLNIRAGVNLDVFLLERRRRNRLDISSVALRMEDRGLALNPNQDPLPSNTR